MTADDFQAAMVALMTRQPVGAQPQWEAPGVRVAVEPGFSRVNFTLAPAVTVAWLGEQVTIGAGPWETLQGQVELALNQAEVQRKLAVAAARAAGQRAEEHERAARAEKEQRGRHVLAALHAGATGPQLAAQLGMSTARIYQIRDGRR